MKILMIILIVELAFLIVLLGIVFGVNVLHVFNELSHLIFGGVVK